MLINRVKKFAQKMKTLLTALYVASKDPTMPRRVKWLIIAVVAYALSPIDLIPDFIPIVGYLDELILLPLGIYIAIKLIPNDLWRQSLAKANEHPIQLPQNRYAAWMIICCWIVLVAAMGYGLCYYLIK